MCENLVRAATTISKLQHFEYLKPVFLGTFKWAIRPVFPDWVTYSHEQASTKLYLIQNSQAVKKVCGPQKGYGEKRCEIQGGGQEMAVMVG